jgi:hypothetical protein
MHDSPLTWSLRRENWQLFATLTFNEKSVSKARKLTPFFTWVREVARVKRVHYKSIVWALRLELGESTQRPHYHVLIAGLPANEVSRPTCGVLENLWRGLGFGKVVDVRLWDGRDAVSYIADGLPDLNAGANSYEVGKYGGKGVERFEVSHSFTERWKLQLTIAGTEYASPRK